MTDYYDEPELTGYEPHGERPLRSVRMQRTIRIVVILGIVALVLPGILTTYSLARATAQAACAATVAALPASLMGTRVGSRVQFEVFGPGGLGWQCYTVGAYGGDRQPVAPLGLIPTYPSIQAPTDGS
ncbi:hypothetical protein [Subtercola lobariae]|uniref:Uncharacterized protein n=1 Tax=Subtercola lobariae TaxID=1588641 RepID=A0A917B8B5_9MICO|nr:hypothetical protein [Subtercola lobariae]GGF28200.1 hypothetical protein GCM10011399_21780 [Subtercola lobariae]